MSATKQIIEYMHNNVPIAVLIGMSMVNRYVFEGIECSNTSKGAAVIIFLVFTSLNIVWTLIRSKHDFTTNYPHTGNNWMKYAWLQCLVSTLSFFSFDYYIHKGEPFNCLAKYNERVAEAMFYVSFTAIAFISYVEHSRWKKLPINILPDIIEDDDFVL